MKTRRELQKKTNAHNYKKHRKSVLQEFRALKRNVKIATKQGRFSVCFTLHGNRLSFKEILIATRLFAYKYRDIDVIIAPEYPEWETIRSCWTANEVKVKICWI